MGVTTRILILTFLAFFTLQIGELLVSSYAAKTVRFPRQFVTADTSLKFSGRGPGMLYPRESESRQIQLLDGMWNFRADKSDCRCEGLMKKWYLKPLSEVLTSYMNSAMQTL